MEKHTNPQGELFCPTCTNYTAERICPHCGQKMYGYDYKAAVLSDSRQRGKKKDKDS